VSLTVTSSIAPPTLLRVDSFDEATRQDQRGAIVFATGASRRLTATATDNTSSLTFAEELSLSMASSAVLTLIS
jgi:hypothetical protein